MQTREKLFSVSIHDCEVQVFRAGGNGGQNVNKRLTGVRIIHHPSGARAECRETRSQLENRRRAFKRMAETPQFRGWVAVQTGRIKSDNPSEAYYLADQDTIDRHAQRAAADELTRMRTEDDHA